MNEPTTIIQFLQQLPYIYLVIFVLFILLLITKNNFSQPSNVPHKDRTAVLAIFILLFAIIPAVYFGWGFYQAYFPNLKYEEVSSQVGFHIYRPSYLPKNIHQISAFHSTETPRFDISATVRVYFGKKLEQMVSDTKGQIIVISQSRTPDAFLFVEFLRHEDEKSSGETNLELVQLTSFPNTPAFLQLNSVVTTLWIYTNDRVLISIASPSVKTPAEELVKIAESLE